MPTPTREPEEHEGNDDIAMINAIFVADKLLQRLAPLDLDSVSHHVLPDALSALSQLATAQAAYRQAVAAERQAEQLKRIADVLEYQFGSTDQVEPELRDYRKNSRPGESIAEYHARREAGYA